MDVSILFVHNGCLIILKLEGGGVVVQHRNSNQEVLGSIPTCGTVLFPRIHRKRRFCPDKTEKLLTGTLNLKTNKQIISNNLYRAITLIVQVDLCYQIIM